MFVGIVLILSAGLLVLPDFYQSPYSTQEERYSAEVLEVDNSLIQQFGIVKAGSQRMKVRILEGPHAGREVAASNDLIGKMESDKMFRPGDRAFLVVSIGSAGGEILGASAYDHDRLPVEGLLLVLFAVLLIGFSGWSGAKALLSFFFAVLVMWKVLFPGILQGFDPIWVALGGVSLIAGVTLFLVAGVTRTAWVAWLGSLLGILLTASLALVLFPAFRLHGAIQPFSETLLYSGFDNLNLGRLFVSAIFLGASGAVIDVAIDVAAAMAEVSAKRPDLSRFELTRSGFRVGRAMVSTMVTTLLMAYVSGSIALLLVLLSKGIPAVHILNLNFIAAEILRTVVGSFGLVTVAPFTAVVGGFFLVKGGKNHAPIPAYRGSPAGSIQDRSQPG
ncbi:MAG: YibE/F family protein [Syntrophaceae bacterium]|nr:YibE/F family protein [Syntrophaceae bacterium]